MCSSDTSHHFTLFLQTTEDGRERKTLDRAAEEENWERGPEDDEEGAKNCRQALITLRSAQCWARGMGQGLRHYIIQYLGSFPSRSSSRLKRIITPQSLFVPHHHRVSTNSHLSHFSCCSHARYTVHSVRMVLKAELNYRQFILGQRLEAPFCQFLVNLSGTNERKPSTLATFPRELCK